MTGIDATTQPLPAYKVVVLGESSVGKTSLVHRFTSNKFNTHTSNTIGAAFITKEFSSTNNPEKKINLEIWDTAGQERYRSLTPMYYRNAKVALVCFDLSNFDHTFVTAKYWIDQLNLNNSSSIDDDIEIRLVGTKSDLIEDNILINNEVESFLSDKNHSIKEYNQTSSKNGTGIIELFENIIDNISEEFIQNHYESLKKPKDNSIGSMLQFRQNQSSSCC
ncbi:YPT53 [Candida pseudojiufengensis]|uniref:YPT53 n=1 Tax=Candida pseudojiufengensis TaxID=497109 RepID=UPI002223FE35|nr:YPT53 [Candida pseudojiufengensis]KAI5961182.1 YPT53 [Candida pseudojiufengensis]